MEPCFLPVGVKARSRKLLHGTTVGESNVEADQLCNRVLCYFSCGELGLHCWILAYKICGPEQEVEGIYSYVTVLQETRGVHLRMWTNDSSDFGFYISSVLILKQIL
jgi:hypothetical protein